MTAVAGGISNIVSGLSSALSGLTPGQMLLLGGHLTTSNEAKAMSYLAAMAANPATAAAYLALLGSVPNLPPQVMTWASNAVGSIGTPVFAQDLAQAQAALQQVISSEGVLQQAFGY